jgi:ubiquinone/menaquinone biosynthesis C-methylase UbiE
MHKSSLAEIETWSKWEEDDNKQWLSAGCTDDEYSSFIDMFKKEMPKNSRILEIGCGWGNFTLRLAREGYNTFGLDVSPKLCLMAKQKAERAKLGKTLKFVVGDTMHLPFPDKSFDVVVSPFVLHHVPDSLETVLKEVRRVLKEGGRFIAVEPSSYNLLEDIYYLPVLKIKSPNERPISPKKVRTILSNVGFKKISMYPISFYSKKFYPTLPLVVRFAIRCYDWSAEILSKITGIELLRSNYFYVSAI